MVCPDVPPRAKEAACSLTDLRAYICLGFGSRAARPTTCPTTGAGAHARSRESHAEAHSTRQGGAGRSPYVRALTEDGPAQVTTRASWPPIECVTCTHAYTFRASRQHFSCFCSVFTLSIRPGGRSSLRCSPCQSDGRSVSSAPPSSPPQYRYVSDAGSAPLASLTA